MNYAGLNNLWMTIKAVFAMLVLLLLVSCSGEHQQVSLSYPDADSKPALLYISKCNECHNAPLTTAHTAKMWVSVVDRMQFRMISKKIFPLSEEDKLSILQYLQTHAKKE